MNAPYENDMGSALPEWVEAFPEPQTMPSGWDLSGLVSAQASASAMDNMTSAND